MPPPVLGSTAAYPSLPIAAQAVFVAREIGTNSTALWILNEPSTLGHIKSALRSLAPDLAVRSLPAQHAHTKGDGPSREERTAVAETLLALLEEKPGITLLLAEQLLLDVPMARVFLKGLFELRTGKACDQEAAVRRLTEIGYEKGKEADEAGSFARKGEQIDLTLTSRAIRIGWAYDSIETITDRKTEEALERITIPPISQWESDAAPLRDLLQTLQKTVLFEDDPQQLSAILGPAADPLYSRVRRTFSKRISFPVFGTNVAPAAHRLPPHLNLIGSLKRGSLGKSLVVFTRHPRAAQAFMPEGTDIRTLPEGALPFPGFVSESWKQTVLTDYDLPELAASGLRPARKRADLAFIQALRVGDYVVHTDHGVGKFEGTEFHTVDGGEREYLALGYAEGDRLLVPVEYSEKVGKYLGASTPIVHRLNGASWQHVKARVAEDAEKLAHELLAAAAEREAKNAFAFPVDSAAIKKLIAAFPYEETPDQKHAWEEIREEMEGWPDPAQKKPMDRLLAGDVGFGKTELAIRAAFKAADAGKQAMVLAPTTILAQQHFDTFSRRLEGTGMQLGLLTRFGTSTDQKKVADAFTRGDIGILIGTHRLLSRDIVPKDLGLLVVDEEQKFGVHQKERLKRMKAETDVLSLSATPIPRTLHASVSGLRTLSTIATPPKGRKEVVTTIHEYEDKLVDAAVRRETARGGQVFYLHNRVLTISAHADRLRARYPDLRIDIGHGQMTEQKLQDVMHQFNIGQIDILVCTTIVENGLDLPNVNTLVVHDATNLGLAQLYQLRGRIGRGEREAYAYFLFHRKKLTGIAQKRLEALQEAQRLGSGLELALRDMEIRGAGNLLGKEQSGRINAIGIGLYARLLAQAVEELRTGKRPAGLNNVSVDLPLPAYLPKDYIIDGGERLEAYQRMAAAAAVSEEALVEEVKHMEEIHGQLPETAQNFVTVLRTKTLAQQVGMTSVDTQIIAPVGRERIERYVLGFERPPHPRHLYGFVATHPAWTATDARTLRTECTALGSDARTQTETLMAALRDLEKELETGA